MKWPVKKLGDVANICSGGTPDRSNKSYYGGDIAWVKSGELSQKLIIDTEEKITKAGLENSSAKIVNEGTILMAMYGATVGLVSILGVQAATNQAVCCIEVKAEVNKQYLLAYLKTLKDYLLANRVGGAQPNLNQNFIKNLKIPLPPLAEQQRIAVLLDTADHIIKQRESAIAKLDQLAQSVFVDMFSNCTNFENIKSVVLKKKIPQPEVDQQVWSLSLDQIESDTGNLKNKVMVEFKNLGSSTYFFEPPVILYSKLRPYLNKVFMPTDCGYATTELVPLYCNEKKVLPIYLLAVLRSKKFVEFANTNSGGAKMPRVIMDKFWDYEFAVPSIQQQQKFADFFTSILNQKRHCLNAYTLNQALLSSLQHKSFAVN
jgi:restriction endonuclease S subunit